jgi:hypothetical protein
MTSALAEIPKLLLSKKEAAAALGVCPRTLHTLIRDKVLRTVTIRRRCMIHTRELARFARTGTK